MVGVWGQALYALSGNMRSMPPGPLYRSFDQTGNQTGFPHLAHNFAVRQAFRSYGLFLVLEVDTVSQDLHILFFLYDSFDTTSTSKTSVYIVSRH